MINLINIQTDKELKTLVEDTIQKGGFASVLYVSPWDKISVALLNALRKSKFNATIHVVNSWDTPKVFNEVHPVTKTPTLVNITKTRDFIVDYPAQIWEYFKA